MASSIKKLIPMFDRVLVLRADPKTKTKGGILLPDSSQKRASEGTVVAVGPGMKNQKGELVPLQINVGDKVLLPEYGGTRVQIEDEKHYQLFRESDLLAKLA